jgi:hypothetical protein
MIRVERGDEISSGVFAYTVPSLGLSSRSRQPPLVPAGKLKRSLVRPDSLQAYSVRDTRAGISVAGLMWGPNLRSRRRALVESALPSMCHSRRHSGKPLSKARDRAGQRDRTGLCETNGPGFAGPIE